MKTKSIRIIFFALLSVSIVFSSCKASRTAKGGAIGAAAGGAIGAGIGNHYDNTVMGAIIGAAVGGTAGALIGRHMDKQSEELAKDLEGAQVERVEEGIRIVFDGGAMFAVNSSELNSGTKTELNEMTVILNKYPDTNILIEGHTDNTGKDEYNQQLSEKRAKSVYSYLVAQGVDGSRLTNKGYGETQPIADNETDAGRAKNRRVDIAITANDKMIKAAENGELGKK